MTKRIFRAICAGALVVFLVAALLAAVVVWLYLSGRHDASPHGLLPWVLAGLGIALTVSLYLARYLAKGIVKPLRELDLDAPLPQGGYEELQPLLRRMEAQKLMLQSQEKLRREFTANVSHELKTPLHAISGYAELMTQGMVKAEDVPEFSQNIYREAQRMTRLVEDILHLSQLDEGAQQMDWEQVDAYELVRQELNTLESMARDAQVQLTLSGQTVMVWGIPQLLRGIVRNLCVNAIKYNKTNGSVAVSLAADKNDLVLTVADTGIGIPQKHQSRIFERFYRVDKSRSRAVGGTGLGLSIVKHAVLVHRGTVELQSTEGLGTTVKVTLPLK